jgi:heptosyltransferase III
VRTLAIRPGGIGDLIVSLPALESLPEAGLEVWTTARNVPLIRFAPARSISSTGLDLLGISDASPPRLLYDLSAFDTILSWYGANRPDFREYVAARGMPFVFLDALPREGAGIHATDFYIEQVMPFAARAADPVPRIRCEVEPGDFAVIHPFSGSPRKNWPLERFRGLAGRLERMMPVRWCAGPEDPPLASAERFDDLYDLAHWLARARLYIGNDSGITHLAAAVGTPTLALFGPTDPAVWGPRGANVRIARWHPKLP